MNQNKNSEAIERRNFTASEIRVDNKENREAKKSSVLFKKKK